MTDPSRTWLTIALCLCAVTVAQCKKDDAKASSKDASADAQGGHDSGVDRKDPDSGKSYGGSGGSGNSQNWPTTCFDLGDGNGDDCLKCAMRRCCDELKACAEADGGNRIIYDGCYNPTWPCIRKCFGREVASSSLSPADLAESCAQECGEVTTERANLLACMIATPTSVDSSDGGDADDGGAAEPCAATCFSGWH
jgi:hypothetical protein